MSDMSMKFIGKILSKDYELLTYEERIDWFLQHYYETGMEYQILLDAMKNEDLDNFKWHDSIIHIPKYKHELNT